MTVSSSTSRASYSGNGSLATFAYTFKVFDQDDLTVILRASNGTETVQTITTDYTVTGVGDVGGGNVVFGTAPASGVTVVILRDMDLEQGLDLVPNDPFPAQSLEDSLDKLTFMVQQHDEQLGRAIKASRTNELSGSEFVISAADRANKVFSFDASGDLAVTQELGTFKGDWATSTGYKVRDLVKDTSTNNIFFVNSEHTSSGEQPLTTNANSAKYDLIVDIGSPPGDLTVGGNISTSGSVTAGNFVIGSADINENDLEAIDSIVAGTVAASKAVVVDVNKDISSFRNLTATGDITFGGLSDGTITVTDILDEDDLTSNSATSLATQQSIKAYVDSQVGSVDTLSEVLANGSTTGGTNLSVSTGDDIKFADGSQAIFGASDDLRINHNGSYSYISDLGQGPLFIGGNEDVSIMNGQLNEYKIKAETNGAVTLYYDNVAKIETTTLGIDVTGTITFDGGETTSDLYFGDNDKAIFGAGSDLQIYHDTASGDSIIKEDSASGGFKILGTNIALRNSDSSKAYIIGADGGAVTAYHNGSAKLATTSTGVDITGTLTSDGLTVDGTTGVTVSGLYPTIFFGETDTTDLNTRLRTSGGSLNISTVNDAYTGGVNRFNIDHSTGDISFYEDTGTTPKFFWDASAESLGIGTTDTNNGRSLVVHTPSTVAAGGTQASINNLNGNFAMIGYRTSGLANDSTVRAGAYQDDFAIYTGSSERMRIDSSGVVQISNSTPTLKFTDTDNNYDATVQGLSGSLVFTADSGSEFGTESIQFKTGGSEAMRIDSSGNLLVGKTSTSINTAGSRLIGGGSGAQFTADGTEALALNRLTDDGDLIWIGKSGSKVGSIGTIGSKLTIGSGATGVRFNYAGVDTISPWNTSTNALTDGATSLGYTGTRFKDLYLSGDVDTSGVFKGTNGTAAAPTHSFLNDPDNGMFRPTTNTVAFSTAGSERMRIDSSGNLLVGKTSSDTATAGTTVYSSGYLATTVAQNTAGSGAVAQFRRNSTDGDILKFLKDGSTVGSIGTSGGRVYLADDATNGITFSSSSAIMWPSNSSGGVVDNTMDIGSSSYRFDDIYATNGTIQTSDRNEKQDIAELSDAEQRVAVAAKGLLRKFRWKDAVAEKGDEARTHFGIIAQDLQAAFAAEGLDAGDYAMFIHSTWTDEETGEEKSRMGVRYSELLAFIIAAI